MNKLSLREIIYFLDKNCILKNTIFNGYRQSTFRHKPIEAVKQTTGR